MILWKEKVEHIYRLSRSVNRVNLKMVERDTWKTVFIRVDAERDAIILLKLRTANNAGRCVVSYVINALVTNACVLRTRVRGT